MRSSLQAKEFFQKALQVQNIDQDHLGNPWKRSHLWHDDRFEALCDGPDDWFSRYNTAELGDVHLLLWSARRLLSHHLYTPAFQKTARTGADGDDMGHNLRVHSRREHMARLASAAFLPRYEQQKHLSHILTHGSKEKRIQTG